MAGVDLPRVRHAAPASVRGRSPVSAVARTLRRGRTVVASVGKWPSRRRQSAPSHASNRLLAGDSSSRTFRNPPLFGTCCDAREQSSVSLRSTKRQYANCGRSHPPAAVSRKSSVIRKMHRSALLAVNHQVRLTTLRNCSRSVRPG